MSFNKTRKSLKPQSDSKKKKEKKKTLKETAAQLKSEMIEKIKFNFSQKKSEEDRLREEEVALMCFGPIKETSKVEK